MLPPLRQRLLFVIGKGGVGKSTITAALALEAARTGKRVLVCEMAARSRMGVLEGVPGIDRVHILPSEAMREYALMILKFPALYRTVFENRFVAPFLRAIPSLAELVCLGKIIYHARETLPDGRFRYDQVLVDAPATGHGLSLLRLPRVLVAIIPSGPMRSEALTMRDLLEDPEQAAALLVTLPEELPVTETLELERGLREQVGMARAAVVLNGCSLRPTSASSTPAHRIAERYFERTERYAALLHERLGLPMARVPILGRRIDRPALEKIGRFLGDSPLPEVSPREWDSESKEASPRPEVARSPALARALREKRLLVCLGSGGVGKTTFAAALALQAALDGRRVCVCTIDPARRLANALGLDSFANVETRVPLEDARGELHAVMLDLKQSWDDLMARHLSARDFAAIRENQFYQQLSTTLAGSQEYAALEKLAALSESGAYDLVVLDTPPTAHALDFLDSPDRVLDFLGNETVRTLLAPLLKASGLGLRLVHRAGGVVVQALSKLTGLALLEELARFLAALEPLYGAFQKRAAGVKAMLASDAAGFILVAAPRSASIDEALQLAERLKRDRMPIVGAIVNRIIEPGAGMDWMEGWARLQGEELARLEGALRPIPVYPVPQLEEDPHDRSGLRRLLLLLSGNPPTV